MLISAQRTLVKGNVMGVYGRGRPKRWNPFTGEGSAPPDAPGEYRVRDRFGNIKYIGETNNLRRRIREHKSRGKIRELGEGTVDWMKASVASDSFSRREHERRSIRKHNPELNRSRGGEGRPAMPLRIPNAPSEIEKPERGFIGRLLSIIKWVLIILVISIVLVFFVKTKLMPAISDELPAVFHDITQLCRIIPS